MRKIEITLIYHKEAQFPITVKDLDGNNVCEIPYCEKTIEFFGIENLKPGQATSKTCWCED